MRSALGAAIVFLASLATDQPAPKPQLDDLLDKLSAYLLAYEPELSALIAEETLVQQVTTRARTNSPNRRRLLSDVAFLRLPGDGAWLGYREVKRVDDRAVARKGPSLMETLARPSRDNERLAMEMAWESARFNLGAARTTNMPGLPLELMQPRHRQRFKFRLGGRARVGGLETIEVGFEEHTAPSLIKNPDSTWDMQSIGTLWVEPGTGRLRKAEVRIRDWSPRPFGSRPFENVFIVEFVDHAALGLLVPKSMIERFYVPAGTGEGRAVYSNFRRFSTSARIVPQ